MKALLFSYRNVNLLVYNTEGLTSSKDELQTKLIDKLEEKTNFLSEIEFYISEDTIDTNVLMDETLEVVITADNGMITIESEFIDIV